MTVRLPTGHTAFFQRRVDDCLRAAFATLMQVHIMDVPDPRIRWDNRREFDLNPGGVEATDPEAT